MKQEPKEYKKRCVLTAHDVQSIKDLVFIVGGNSESSAQKVIFEILADGMRDARPHPAPADEQCRICSQATAKAEREKVLDEMVKLSMMIETNETERWESCGRPKNDGYINGSHSGYGHALRDMRQWIDQIKKAESLRKEALQ